METRPVPEPAPTRREREREARRTLFIDVAHELFLKQGYEGTSIDQVARAAEFSKRAVYLYFENKHELFSAVVLRCLERVQAYVRPPADPPPPGREHLLQFGRGYARFALDEPQMFELTMSFERRDYHRGKAGGTQGPNARRCIEVNDSLAELMDAAIERGREDGSLTTELSPRQLTLLIWAALSGVLQIAVLRRDVLPGSYGLTADDLAEHAIAHLIPAQRPGADSR